MDGAKYVLMLCDDHSDYKWFFPIADTLAEHAANTIIDWCAAFAVPLGLMGDGPTHSKNETVHLLTKGVKVPHHFTFLCCPWSNGTVKRLGKELPRTVRAVVSELQMQLTEWPDLLPLLQNALSNALSAARGNASPVMAFMNMEPTQLVSSFLGAATMKSVSVSKVQLERKLKMAALQERCAALHPAVQNTPQVTRNRSTEAVAKGNFPNFGDGDYVLVSRLDFHADEKLALRWRGLRRVVKALKGYVFQVEDLHNGQLNILLGTVLKLYTDSAQDKEVIMPHVLSSETGMCIARLMELLDGPEGLKGCVRWKGLPHADVTPKPIGRV